MMAKERKTLNVLMVTARYFPYMGGIETHVHEVGRRLVERGINITVLTTVSPSPANPLPLQLPKEEMIEGMRIVRVPAWPPQRDYYIAPEIFSLIKHGNWDLVHCQGCHTFVPLMAMVAAKAAKLPYILTFHTGGHSSGFRNRIRTIQWKVQRPLLANASTLIGVSHFEADYFRDLLHLPAAQFIVIPNGAVVPEVEQMLAGVKQCSTVGRGSTSTMHRAEQMVIASVGRLERYKGHQRLITALPKLQERYPDIRLLIVGKGPYEGALRELARSTGVADQVEFRAVPADDRRGMAELLMQATCVALLSEYESQGIAIMEALALRRPVLVTNTSGMKELAEQGFVRAIPLNSSPEKVALALQQQIEEPILPPERLSLPNWEDCVNQLQTVYQRSIIPNLIQKRHMRA